MTSFLPGLGSARRGGLGSAGLGSARLTWAGLPMVRRGQAWLVRLGSAGCGEARLGAAPQGRGMTGLWLGGDRHCGSGQGWVWRGGARSGSAWLPIACQGSARQVQARHGMTGQGNTPIRGRR